jgi:hypothetical protein
MYKDDVDYVRMRLVGTVVRDKKEGQLVYVEGVHFGGALCAALEAEVRVLGEEEFHIVPLTQLDLASPPLGNTDVDGITYYVSRMPKRNDWRQGLRRENLMLVHRGREYGYLFNSLGHLSTPVYNVYPPYEQTLEEGGSFSRMFSLDKERKLWYKCREVVGKDVEGVPTLDEKHEWLKEALEDDLR